MSAGLVLDGLALYRLTRLATADVLTQPLREPAIRWAYLVQHGGEPLPEWLPEVLQQNDPDVWQQVVEQDTSPPKLATLVTCRWCASVWIGLAVLPWRRTAAWRALRWVLAGSAVSALLAGLEDR